MSIRTIVFRNCAFLLLAAAGGVAAAEAPDWDRVTPVPAGEPIPISDFFRPALFSDPQLSPSGTRIAALITVREDRRQMMIYELASRKIGTLDARYDNDIFRIHWLTDDRVIFGIGLRKRYGMGMFAADVGGLLNCYPLLQYVGSSLVGIPLNDRLHPLLSIAQDTLNSGMRGGQVVRIDSDLRFGPIVNLFKAGTRYNDLKDVEAANQRHILSGVANPGKGMDAGYLADREGRLDFAFTCEAGDFAMHELVGDSWKRCPVDLGAVDVLASGRAHGEVVVLGPRAEGRPRAVAFLNAATGELGDVLLQDKAYDFAGYFYRDAGTRNIVGAVYDRGGPHVVWFNESYRALQKALNARFPGLVVRILGSDEAGRIFLVMTFSDRQPAMYYSADMAAGALGPIKASQPWIDPARMQPMSIMRYKTRDRRSLDAYVTLPRGASKTNPPPLVVLVDHVSLEDSAVDNTRDRVSWGYDARVQFLASRGYAVLQANHRGSGGYEWMFPEAKQVELLKMGEDVGDATRELVAGGFVDGRRVAVMGFGTGASLALNEAANEPDTFRCALAVQGVYDFDSWLKEEKHYQFDDYFYSRALRRIGDPQKDQARLTAISPARHADRLRCAVFIAYEKVGTINLMQSKEMVAALEHQSVPHTALALGDERFGLAHVEHRIELYEGVEAFLRANLAPPAAASPAPPPAR